jgi:hypothetical protein
VRERIVMSEMYSTSAAGFVGAARPLPGLLPRPGWQQAALRRLALPLGDAAAVAASLAAALTLLGSWNWQALLVLPVSFGTVHLWLGLYDTAGHASLERLRLRVTGAVLATGMAIALLALSEQAGASALVTLLLAGLLEVQRDAVEVAYTACGCTPLTTDRRNDWSVLTLRAGAERFVPAGPFDPKGRDGWALDI